MQWLTDNLGTIVTVLLLLAVITLIIVRPLIGRKKKKSGCGGDCSCCSGCPYHKE